MSYDVDLVDETGKIVEVKSHTEGGTYALGGSPDASLNITYNYAQVYGLFDFSIRNLNGIKAKDWIEKLEWLVEKLGIRQYEPDYWAPTPGNAGHALNILLGWAKLHPQATFEVS